MFRKNLVIAAVLSALAIPSLASAGLQSVLLTVRVHKYSSGSGYFYGALGSARNSSDSRQYIGCHVSNDNVAGCSARDQSGTSASCTTQISAQIATIKNVTDSSYVFASFGANGQCTSVTVSNRSYYAPK